MQSSQIPCDVGPSPSDLIAPHHAQTILNAIAEIRWRWSIRICANRAAHAGSFTGITDLAAPLCRWHGVCRRVLRPTSPGCGLRRSRHLVQCQGVGTMRRSSVHGLRRIRIHVLSGVDSVYVFVVKYVVYVLCSCSALWHNTSSPPPGG